MFMVSVLLSTSVKRFSVSPVRDFFYSLFSMQVVTCLDVHGGVYFVGSLRFLFIYFLIKRLKLKPNRVALLLTDSPCGNCTIHSFNYDGVCRTDPATIVL